MILRLATLLVSLAAARLLLVFQTQIFLLARNTAPILHTDIVPDRDAMRGLIANNNRCPPHGICEGVPLHQYAVDHRRAFQPAVATLADVPAPGNK